MANFSPNYNLELPTTPEHYDINVFNKNYMVIDSELNKLDLKDKGHDEIIATEVSRATNQENVIMEDLNHEISRATNAEEAINDKIEKISENINNIHIHNNKSTLDKITESNGTLLFDGKEFSDGQDGISGENGKSAYEIAIENGFEGTVQEWLESLKGDPGENGQDADISNITPENIGAASANHAHGYMKTIALSTTEPATVADGEIVMVYETV